MPLLGLPDDLLDLGALPSPLECLLLLGDDPVRLPQDHLNLPLVGTHQGRLVLPILLILRVQVEDHLGQLGDLLRHLVVHVLGLPTCSSCHVFLLLT